MTASRKRANPKKETKKGVDQKKETEKTILSKSTSKNEDPSNTLVSDPWAPGSYISLKALISARLCSAVWGIINDCDETYNYWEPTHFLLYGKGFQTWEYSPAYALRSYTYLMLHAGPAFLYSRLLQSNRMLVFFFIRCFLALVAALCELYFYRGVCKTLGANIGRITLGVTIFSAGMFIASTAYLPSSFAMYMTMFSFGAWFHGSLQLAIFATALSTFLGWPFAALVGLPIAFDILILKRKYMMFFKWCFISSFTILMPMAQYDSAIFGRFVVAPLNLVLYNVFSNNGPDLYGTAPISYYLYNGLLNFNFLFPLAIVSLPLYCLCTVTSLIPARRMSFSPIWLPFGALYLWLVVFFVQPHKEERFLFPVYPLICLAAALGIDTIEKLFFSLFVRNKKNHYLHYANWMSILCITLTSVVSLLRIIGQYQAYRAPFDTFLELQRLDQERELPNLRYVNVCYGREWHRYPSSFFLPSLNWNVKFIESEFRGQLPGTFAPDYSNATSVIPGNMNDQNKEEKSRYVPISSCHFLIDIDKEDDETDREPRYSLNTNDWKVIQRIPFLDAQKSSRLFRAFYVPFLTEKYCRYVDYVILQSTKLSKIHPGL